MYIVCHERIHGMLTDAPGKSRDLVGYRAEFEADTLILHALHDAGVVDEGKPVTDPLRPKIQCMGQVVALVGDGLAAMEKEGLEGNVDTSLLAPPLEAKELRDKRLEGFPLGFFAGEVEACNPSGPLEFETEALAKCLCDCLLVE